MAATSFDFVIVGGGLAGLVLAARLSENSDVEVLVVEAGDDQTADPRVNIPAMWPTLIRTKTAWNFNNIPQEGLQNREIGFPQEKILGGSSALNGLAFSATSKVNVDAWESLGNPGLVRIHAPEDEGEWPTVWEKTLEALGYPSTGNPFEGQFSGSTVVPDSVQPATKQRIWTKAEVEKILFDPSADIIATGVQLIKDGETQIVKARKEVILTAGTINSPRLLELSGIGSAELLKSLGIDVVIDNSHIGENLQNHPMCTLSFEVKDQKGFDTIDKLARQDGAAIAGAMEAYSKQKGPFSESGANLVAQLPTPKVETGADTSELAQFLQSKAPEARQELTSFQEHHKSFVRSVLLSSTEASACYIAIPGFAGLTGDGWIAPTPPEDEKYFTISLLLAHPLSRGSVHLKQLPSGSKALVIDPKYLNHPLDVEVMARHLQLVEKIASSEPLAAHLKLDGTRNPSAPPYGSLANLDAAKDYLHKTLALTTSLERAP
ncbi:hypothetical protein LQW54_000030 [Pestalotiopsis sp. IQ-011]